MVNTRRNFIRSAAACGLGTALLRSQTASSQADAHIEVLPLEPIGTIAPDIYGHFIEHLGGVIYDGVWVGPDSKVPNVGGIRRALIDALKQINAPVIRWPGGCFADSYDWHDGVGSASDRKPRTNFWGGTDPNTFGVHEFLHLTELTGAKPYLAGNLRSLPARDFYQWVEYCNSPANTTYGSKQRAQSGHAEPYNVQFWGVGNESWGCGGNFTPQDYVSELRRFTAWIPQYGPHLNLIASGPNEHDLEWTRGVMHGLADKHLTHQFFGLSVHYYTWNLSLGRTTNWELGKRDALRFSDTEWYELFSQGNQMEPIIRDHWTAMAETDPDHHLKLIVDEWGAWYAPGTEIGPNYRLSQMSTLRDALLSGLTLDIFHRHAEKVGMANAAQLINCLHSLMLASGDKFILTPTYHVFRMYQPHMGAQAVRTEFAAPSLTYERSRNTGNLWGLNGSASVSGKNLTITAVNPNLHRALETEIVVRGASIESGKGLVLTNTDMHAHNDFQNPDVVKPADVQVSVNRGRAVHAFPPASVTALYLRLV